MSPADIRDCPGLLIHFWAEWDGHDLAMSARIEAVRPDYEDRVCFRSCDVDRPPFPEIWAFAKPMNVPTLAYIAAGKRIELLIGLRSETEIRERLDGWLSGRRTEKRPGFLDRILGRHN